MVTFIALLRGINVGGNTTFPMAELKAICEAAGLQNVRTYIQSGNVLFESALTEAQLVQVLEEAIKVKQQKHIPVMIRSLPEMEAVLVDNPFPDAEPAKVGVLFLSKPVSKDLFKNVMIPGPEKVVVSGREIYIHYPDGMGRSKLKFPKMPEQGTMRNINTVTKLVKIAE
jgi:uncharacterized protein (DUF1697 family)